MNSDCTGNPSSLRHEEYARYESQMLLEGFGEAGQEKLKRSTVLISRCGGLGGPVAMELAAAGIGKLVIASGGVVLPSDLNRQLLQTPAQLGSPRVIGIETWLRAFRPDLELEIYPENLTDARAIELAKEADVLVDAAPLFEERYAINRAAVRLGKPLVECAMYALEAYITTIFPGRTPCLACLYPEPPPTWTRRFPVFGAVSGSLGCMAAMEVIKVLTSLGQPLTGRLLKYDLGTMDFRVFRVQKDAKCSICATVEC